MNGYKVAEKNTNFDRHNFLAPSHVTIPDAVGKIDRRTSGLERSRFRCRLAQGRLRHTDQRSRPMRIVLGFLRHWFIGRSNLRQDQETRLALRTKLGRLLGQIRQHGL